MLSVDALLIIVFFDALFFVSFFFFFSSRRRHTRCSRDWSSDVCSSDLCKLCCVISVAVLVVSATTFHADGAERSEEHTSELQSRLHLVCRLLLEKKNKYTLDTNNQYISMMSLHHRSHKHFILLYTSL